jgi:hypothetical protein
MFLLSWERRLSFPLLAFLLLLTLDSRFVRVLLDFGPDRAIDPSIDRVAVAVGWGCCSWSVLRGRACSGAGSAAWTSPPRTPSSPGISTATPAAPTSSTTCTYATSPFTSSSLPLISSGGSCPADFSLRDGPCSWSLLITMAQMRLL